ncbi:MFS transporter [Ruania alba]|uniref:Predicted arabinose efflux permease, MFS family n=1 Tax=Ruania alba TaxID=648782 RepID=A0A1H5MGW2_9MICO|nr:MFS transporter [Ruania alba]SEE88413.1 Predicted arabinose efflux permease, MFS family [Ruania alba]
MLAPYRRVLSTPGALAFSTAGVLARLPLSMVTLSIVLMVTALYDEYGLAGQITGAYAASQAVFSPRLARLIDSFGQARVMRPALAICMTSLLGMVVAATLGAPVGWLFLTAALTGATTGSVGAMVRSRWNHTLTDPNRLHTAYALEAALDETVFMTGPVIATALATSVSPTAGLVVAVLAAGTGGFWFLSQRATEPVPTGRAAKEGRRSVLRSGALLAVVLVFFATGVVFGASDVSAVAFSEEHGAKAWAGVMLACMAAGSLTGGLAYGARTWVMDLRKRFVIGVLVLTGGMCLFLLVDSLPMLAATMFVAGLAIAPTMINGNALVQQLVPRGRLTEGFTWESTAIWVGFAVGTAVAGAAVDAFGSAGSYRVLAGAGAFAALLALVAAPRLRAAHPRP